MSDEFEHIMAAYEAKRHINLAYFDPPPKDKLPKGVRYIPERRTYRLSVRSRRHQRTFVTERRDYFEACCWLRSVQARLAKGLLPHHRTGRNKLPNA